MRGSSPIQWVIAGGESGPGARPADLAWFRGLRDQCRDAGAAFFMKQVGKSLAAPGDSKGGLFESIPVDLRLREFPAVVKLS